MSESRIGLLNDREVGASRDSRPDGLGFAAYADVLSKAAMDTEGPFTIGIFGEWGTGKTSLLRMIQERVDSDETTVTVWFNAWRYERDEHPIVPLIGTIVQEIERNQRFQAKLADGGSRLLRALRAIAYGFSGSATIGVPGLASFDAALVAKEIVDREESLTPDPLLDRSLYYRAFEDLRHAQLGSDVRIVVLVDDLDRCFPDKAIKLLESIKLVLSQEGFTFILGVARSVIEGYLEHRYREEFGLSGFNGSAYLDKIVQLAFPLPSHSERMTGLAQKLIDQLGPEHVEELSRIVPSVAGHLGDNPRTLIRYLNNVIIDVEIYSRLAGQAREPIPLSFFAVARCLQHRWPEAYIELVDADNDELADMIQRVLESGDRSWSELPDGSKTSTFLKGSDRKLENFLNTDDVRDWLRNHGTRREAAQFLRDSKRESEGAGDERELIPSRWRGVHGSVDPDDLDDSYA